MKNAELTNVLNICLKEQRLAYEIKNKIIVITKPLAADLSPRTPASPPITVKGRVVDEEGKPVEGVTVTVKGTKTMTATNANGEFALYEVDDNVFIGVYAYLY